MQPRLNRRRFMCLAVTVGAVGVGAVPAPGRAFQVQDMPVSVQRTYLSACEAPSLHAVQLAEIDAKLRGESLSEAERLTVRANARCPICGCNVAAAVAPSGETQR